MKAIDPMEGERRAAAWAALSELFVGRELVDGDLNAIARTLRTTGFSGDALERMLWREVAPVFGSNLSVLNPTPQMDGWSPAFVREAVVRHLGRPWHGATAFVACWLMPRLIRRDVQRDWVAVRSRLSQGGAAVR